MCAVHVLACVRPPEPDSGGGAVPPASVRLVNCNAIKFKRTRPASPLSFLPSFLFACPLDKLREASSSGGGRTDRLFALAALNRADDDADDDE